jgi:hypothetical protein
METLASRLAAALRSRPSTLGDRELPGGDDVGATNSADSPAARALAIAQALDALFGARHDDATARFDAELAAAVAAGRLDDDTARTLRWWQRASVRGAQSYLADLLPGVLHADDAAQRRSRAHAELAAASWGEATDAAAHIRAAALGADAGVTNAAQPADRPADHTEHPADPADYTEHPNPDHPAALETPDARLRVRLVAVPRHAARTDDPIPTEPPSGKDTSGDDHSATTA